MQEKSKDDLLIERLGFNVGLGIDDVSTRITILSCGINIGKFINELVNCDILKQALKNKEKTIFSFKKIEFGTAMYNGNVLTSLKDSIERIPNERAFCNRDYNKSFQLCFEGIDDEVITELYSCIREKLNCIEKAMTPGLVLYKVQDYLLMIHPDFWPAQVNKLVGMKVYTKTGDKVATLLDLMTILDWNLNEEQSLSFQSRLLTNINKLCHIDEIMREFWKFFKPIEEVVLSKRYIYDNLKMQELGEQFGVTRGRIQQVDSKALKKLALPDVQKILASIIYNVWVVASKDEYILFDEIEEKFVNILSVNAIKFFARECTYEFAEVKLISLNDFNIFVTSEELEWLKIIESEQEQLPDIVYLDNANILINKTRSKLQNAGYEIENDILKKILFNGHKDNGFGYSRNKISIFQKYDKVLLEFFPNGIFVKTIADIEHFKECYKQIYGEELLSNSDDTIARRIIYSDNTIATNYGGGYIHKDLINFDNKKEIFDFVKDLVKEAGAISEPHLYTEVSKKFPEFIETNKIYHSFFLFSIVRSFFSNDFKFSRMHIIDADSDVADTVDMIKYNFANRDEIKLEEIFEYAKKKSINIYNIFDVIDLMDEYLYVDKGLLANIKLLPIDENIGNQVVDIVTKALGDKEFANIASLNIINQLPQIKVKWTIWLIYAILNKYGKELLVTTSTSSIEYASPIVLKNGADVNLVRGGRKWREKTVVNQVDDLSDLDKLVEGLVNEGDLVDE